MHQSASQDFEIISFKIKLRKNIYNFVATYRQPDEQNTSFLEYLENHISKIIQYEHCFVIGDLNLNMNWMNEKDKQLRDFFDNYKLNNFNDFSNSFHPRLYNTY